MMGAVSERKVSMLPPNAVCVVEGDGQRRRLLAHSLTAQGFEVAAFENIASASLTELDEASVLITAERLPDGSFDELRNKLTCGRNTIPIIVMAIDSDINSAVNAFQLGAIDYLTGPISSFEICDVVRRAITNRTR